MLFVLVCLLYVVSGLLFFIGLSTFALVCDCVLGLAMVAMLTWAFIRYSGRYRSVGGAIDQAAGVVLEQVRTLGVAGSLCLLVSLFVVHATFSYIIADKKCFHLVQAFIQATRGSKMGRLTWEDLTKLKNEKM